MNTCEQPAAAAATAEADASPGDGDDSPSAQRVVTVDADDPLIAPHIDWLQGKLAAACDVLSLDDCELSVIVVDDARMAELHERFAGVPGTTDVLTFDLRDDGAEARRVEGEVYACADEARRQAGRRGHAVQRELLLYGLHGLLHLLGYDDHDDASYRAMHAREDELLEAIGVGRVFETGGDR